MVKLYIPDRGDIVWLDFDPQAGHEQSGHRPAFVISPIAYNQRSSLALVCQQFQIQNDFAPFQRFTEILRIINFSWCKGFRAVKF